MFYTIRIYMCDPVREYRSYCLFKSIEKCGFKHSACCSLLVDEVTCTKFSHIVYTNLVTLLYVVVKYLKSVMQKSLLPHIQLHCETQTM